MPKYIQAKLSTYGKTVAIEIYPCEQFNIVTAGEQIRKEYPEYQNYMSHVREINHD